MPKGKYERKKRTIQEALHAHMTTNERGCKLSTLRDVGNGYVRQSINGEQEFVHRWAWRDAYGDIPKGMEVCHTCDTPNCFEIEHLFLGTHKENMEDRDNKGRQVRGERHHNTEWHYEDIVTMRDWWDEGRYDIDELSAIYDLDMETVARIVNRETWKFYSDPNDKNERQVVIPEKARAPRRSSTRTLSKQDIIHVVRFDGTKEEACAELGITHKQYNYVRAHYNDEGKLDYRKNLNTISYD